MTPRELIDAALNDSAPAAAVLYDVAVCLATHERVRRERLALRRTVGAPIGRPAVKLSREELALLLDQQIGPTEAARRLGVSRDLVWRYRARRAGKERPSCQRFTEAERATVVDSQISVTEAARRLGVSYHVVQSARASAYCALA